MQKIRSGKGMWLVIGVLYLFGASSVPFVGSVAKADTACDSSVNLVQNGSFETPVVTHPALWDIYQAGSPALSGWKASWVSSITTYTNLHTPNATETRPDPQLELQSNGHDGWGFPYDGNQYAELDTDWKGPTFDSESYPSSIDLYQTIQTIPGQQYTFSFAFSPRPDDGDLSDNSVIVGWNGTTIDTVMATSVDSTHTTWSVHTYTTTATASTTRIDFTDAGTPNAIGTFIDAVSVKCVGGTGTGSGSTGGGTGSTATSTDTSTTTSSGGTGTDTGTTTSTSGASSTGSGDTGSSSPSVPVVVTGSGMGGGSTDSGSSSAPVTSTGSGSTSGSSSPSIPSTGTTTSGSGGSLPGEVLGTSTEDTPGFPNTGAGGNSDSILALMALSLTVLAGTLAALVQRFVAKN